MLKEIVVVLLHRRYIKIFNHVYKFERYNA